MGHRCAGVCSNSKLNTSSLIEISKLITDFLKYPGMFSKSRIPVVVCAHAYSLIQYLINRKICQHHHLECSNRSTVK